jgi:hypothetical protein
VDARDERGHDENGFTAVNHQTLGRIPLRPLLIILGIVLLLAGLVFMGQGSRYFPYPAESFMVGASQWIYYGGGIAAVGLALIFLARW